MGTTTLAIGGLLVYPLADLIREFHALGWDGLQKHWKERLKYSAIIAICWWGVLFSYHIFYKVPKAIKTEARNIKPPPPMKYHVSLPDFWDSTTTRGKVTAAPYKALRPLIKQDAFSTLIPFITEESMGMLIGARIPFDSNVNDPLLLTYSEIAGISSISLMPEVDPQSRALKAPTLTDADMKNFLGRMLQYYILRAVSEMQHTITAMSYESGKGTTTVTTSAVIVPDQTEYPKTDLDKLLATVKIPIWHGGLWVWKSYPLKVPKGTNVSFTEAWEGEKIFYIVRFVRAPDFSLDFKIEPAGRNQGQGTFPKYFVPFGPKGIKDAYTYIFVVNLNFQWNGDRMDAEPYVEWAHGLFSGLRKKLVIPN
jgi:hypothetical protein